MKTGLSCQGYVWHDKYTVFIMPDSLLLAQSYICMFVLYIYMYVHTYVQSQDNL